MSLRFKLTVLLFAALMAGAVAWLAWGPSVGLALALALLMGAGLASLLLAGKKEESVPAPQPARASESAAADARATALLEAMMNGMREGMQVIDREMRVVASNRA